MPAYYNEHDPFAAEWLRNLVRCGVLPAGDVDSRDIQSVQADDLRGYSQCHFFAGIGGWPYVLRRAGWPDDRPVWTGSAPCQPFSIAGKGFGTADERHLWPYFFRLVAQCRPSVCFGEQVAGPAGLDWLDLVFADLEGTGYACGAADLSAAGVGAPHIRQRLYWVANTLPTGRAEGRAGAGDGSASESGGVGGMANADSRKCGGVSVLRGDEHDGADAGRAQGVSGASACCEDGRSGPLHGFWRGADWLFCRDEKWRPVEPGTFALAHGLPNRVDLLRAYGNAIVPQVAEEFVRAYMTIG